MKGVAQRLIAIWLGVALVAQARVPEERIDQYIALSGIGEMLDSMPGQIEAMINQVALMSENPALEKELKYALAGAWNPASARSAVERYLEGSSDTAEIDSLLEWKVSPLAKKMMAAEMESYTPAFQEGLRRYMETLEASPPDEETINAISRLVAQAHVANMMVESTVQVTRAMTLALIETGMIDSEEALAELHADMNAMRRQLRPRMERQATLLSLYIYRGMTSDEIDQYAAYYETDLGKRELALAYGSLEAAMAQWAAEAARALADDGQNRN